MWTLVGHYFSNRKIFREVLYFEGRVKHSRQNVASAIINVNDFEIQWQALGKTVVVNLKRFKRETITLYISYVVYFNAVYHYL